MQMRDVIFREKSQVMHVFKKLLAWRDCRWWADYELRNNVLNVSLFLFPKKNLWDYFETILKTINSWASYKHELFKKQMAM